MNIFKRIMACVDLGDEASSIRVLNAALETVSGNDTLHVICVMPDFGMSIVSSFFPADHEGKVMEKATQALHAFTEKNVPSGTQLQHIVSHGNIYEEILVAANKVKADLIVIGARRPKLEDYLLGPNAARVVRHADQSVLVVRPT
ncbi:MAG: universal stress protein [Alphaproteobacteria bacterium]